MPHKRRIVLAGGANGIRRASIAAAVLAGIGGAVTGPEDHHARRAPAFEAVGKAEEGGHDSHWLGPDRKRGLGRLARLSFYLPHGVARLMQLC
jgi:hypothetical protein